MTKRERLKRGIMYLSIEFAKQLHPSLSCLSKIKYDGWFDLEERFFYIESKETRKSILTKNVKSIVEFVNENL